jgi:hypothetical protein
MNAYAADILTADFDFTGVKARSNRQSGLLRASAHSQGTAHCTGWSIEGRQYAVTRALNESSSVFGD